MSPRDDTPIWRTHYSDNNNTPITAVNLAPDANSFAVSFDNSEISLTVVHGPPMEQPIMTTRIRSRSFSESERGPELSSSEGDDSSEGDTECVHGSDPVANVVSESDPDHREEETGSNSGWKRASSESGYEAISEGSLEGSFEKSSEENSEGSSEESSEESSEGGSVESSEGSSGESSKIGSEGVAEQSAEKNAEESSEKNTPEGSGKSAEEGSGERFEEGAEENPENCNEDNTTELLGVTLIRHAIPNIFKDGMNLPDMATDLNSRPPTGLAEPIELPTDSIKLTVSESTEPAYTLHETEDGVTINLTKGITLKLFSMGPQGIEATLKKLPIIAPKLRSLTEKAQNKLIETVDCILWELPGEKKPDVVPEPQEMEDDSQEVIIPVGLDIQVKFTVTATCLGEKVAEMTL